VQLLADGRVSVAGAAHRAWAGDALFNEEHHEQE
jgi:hypothetical protein